MNESKLVSIIIPFYNAEKYISETIESVNNQTYKSIEIILINDGSKDLSEKIVKNFLKEKDIYIKKDNTGISDSRNLGLAVSRGDFLLFLDSDDILESDFIEKRILVLNNNLHLGFCCSNVIKIDQKGNKINGSFRGIHRNINEEVLLYSENVITCPSNYLIRKNVLLENKIYFNINLSSSADRFFLIELSKFTEGGYLNHGGELYYRVHSGSMSNKLSEDLVKDNIKYLEELKIKNYIPAKLKEEFYYRINYILAGSNYKLKNYKGFLKHAILAFYYNPVSFIINLLKKL